MPPQAPLASLLPPASVRIEADLDLGGRVLDVTAHGARAARLARQAGDGHPDLSVRIAARPDEAPPGGQGLWLAGRPLRLHGAAAGGAGEARFVAALRAAWMLPATWFDGYLGTDVEDLAQLLTLAEVVHAAHEPGDLTLAARVLAGRLGGVLRDAPVVCAAFLGPPETRLRALGPAIDALGQAAPRACLHASLLVGVTRPLVALWAAEPAVS